MKRISIAVLSLLLGAALSAQTSAGQGGTTPAKTPPPLPTQAAPAKPATPPPFPADARIGFFNEQAVVSGSKLGRAGQAQMQALVTKDQANVKAKTDEITALRQKMQSQQGVVSDDVMQQMVRDQDRLQRELTAMQQDVQANEQNLNEDLLTELNKQVAPVVDAVRAEKNLWFVFAIQPTDTSGNILLYSGNPALDLSAEIIKRLDAEPAAATK